MRSGSLYPADTLPPPSLEKGYSWLESPGALSSSGSRRPPGQTKLEAQLRRVGLLRQNEVCNPKKMEQWFGIPSEWTNPLELRAATQLLEQDDLLLETALTLGSQRSHSIESSTSAVSPPESGLPISFGKTYPQLLKGKSVTRRLWKQSHAKKFIRLFERGARFPALDKDKRYGGKQVGWLTLVEKPYQERLGNMPVSDLAAEGFPELSLQEFIKRFFEDNPDAMPWVVRFEFEPLELEEFSCPFLTENMICTIKRPDQPLLTGTVVKDLGSSFSIRVDGMDEPLTVPKLYVFPGTEPDPKLQAEKGHYVLLAPLKGIEDWVEVTEVCGDRLHVRLSGGAIQGFHVKHVLAVRPPETAVSGIPLLDAALQAAVGNLEKYQKDGATNTELKEAIASTFGLGIGASTPTWWCAIGGSSPKFWLKATQEGKPDLQGKELIDKVRTLYSIPFPAFHPQTKEQALAQAEFAVGDLVVQYLGKAHLERTGTVTGLSPQWIGADGDKWWEVFYVVRFDDERDGCCEGEVMYDHIKKLPPDFDIEGAIATLINQKKAINPDQYRGAKGGVTSEYKKAENEVRCLQRTIDSLELMKQLPFGTLVRHKDKGEGRVLGHEIDHRGVPMSLVSFEVKDQSVPPHDLEIIENHEQKNTLSSSTANSSINKRGAEDSSGTVDAKSLVEQFPASEIDSGEPADTGRRVQPAHYEVPLEGIAYRQLLAMGLSPEQAKNLLIV